MSGVRRPVTCRAEANRGVIESIASDALLSRREQVHTAQGTASNH